MITIKGTNKIKGALDLSGIGLQLKNGDSYSITEDQFHDYGVQTAVKLGFITHKSSNVPEVNNTVNITLRSIYDRPITLNAINAEIRPGGTFILTEDLVAASDIQGALAKGMIEVVSSTKKVESKEADINLVDPFTDLDSEFSDPMPGVSGMVPETEEEEKTQEDAFLETNEEIEIKNVIDTEKPKPVQKEDIEDPKGKTVVWNPNKDPLLHTKTGMKAIDARDEGPVSNSVDVNEISFVDEEIDEERRKTHPVLKEQKKAEKPDELDFLET